MVELQQKQVEPICRVTVLQQTLHVISQFEERIQAEGKDLIRADKRQTFGLVKLFIIFKDQTR